MPLINKGAIYISIDQQKLICLQYSCFVLAPFLASLIDRLINECSLVNWLRFLKSGVSSFRKRANDFKEHLHQLLFNWHKTAVGLYPRPMRSVVEQCPMPGAPCSAGLEPAFLARWGNHISRWDSKSINGKSTKLVQTRTPPQHLRQWERYYSLLPASYHTEGIRALLGFWHNG